MQGTSGQVVFDVAKRFEFLEVSGVSSVAGGGSASSIEDETFLGTWLPFEEVVGAVSNRDELCRATIYNRG